MKCGGGRHSAPDLDALITRKMPDELRNGAEITSSPITAGSENTPVDIGFDQLIGHLHTAEQPEDLAISPEAQRITPQQRSYCALRVRGFSSAAAARQLNINQMAAHRWSQSVWFEVLCEEERNKWLLSSGIDKRQEMMTPLMGLALDTLKGALISEDEKIRMLAVDKIFETFFEAEKRPIGRPRLERPVEEKVINLSDIQERAKQKIQNLGSNSQGTIDIRANA